MEATVTTSPRGLWERRGFDFFKNLPWWIMYPGKGLLAICGGYVSQNPQIFPSWAVLLGAVVALWIVLAFVWHAINAWREHNQKPRLRLDPSHVIILGLAIAAIGVVWQMRATSKPLDAAHAKGGLETKPPALTGSPLRDAINAYLVKHGNDVSRADDGSIHTGSDSTGDRGPYIAYWNTDVLVRGPQLATDSLPRRFAGSPIKFRSSHCSMTKESFERLSKISPK
jgi:preprotein translocase subunit Sec61beta